MGNYDFCGWATKADLLCSDGRIIRKDAFKHNDGQTVPLVWNHEHNDPMAVLGHALLENRDEGVYAYCTLNDTEAGKNAKLLVQHGDVNALSIYANQLKQQGPNVMHGNIRELSLVLAGANPGASIQSVMMHGEEFDDEAVIYTGEEISLYHSEDASIKKEEETKMENDKKEESKKEEKKDSSKKTIQDVIDTMNEEQKTAMYALVGMAIEGEVKDNPEGGKEDMKHNVFEQDERTQENVLTHADQEAIVNLAKQSGVGTLKAAMEIYANENDSLAHGFENYEVLFPEYELTKKGEPETLERDQSWETAVISKIHKSPISRIRTRQADARIAELRAKGYQNKGDEKKLTGDIKMLSRTTDP